MTDRQEVRFLGLCGALGPPLFVIPVIISGMLTPGFSQISDTISQLEAVGAPYPELVQAAFVAYGILVLAPALGLYMLTRRQDGSRRVLVLFLIYVTSGMLVAVFRQPYYGENAAAANSLIEHVHGLVASLTYFAFVSIALSTAWMFRSEPRWRHFALFSVVVAVFIVFFGGLFQFDQGPNLHGFYERAFMAPSLIWVEVLSLRLFLFSGAPEPQLAYAHAQSSDGS